MDPEDDLVVEKRQQTPVDSTFSGEMSEEVEIVVEVEVETAEISAAEEPTNTTSLRPSSSEELLLKKSQPQRRMPGLQEPPNVYDLDTTRNLLFIDVFSADVKELVGPHYITPTVEPSVDEIEEGSSTQHLCLNTQSLKWNKNDYQDITKEVKKLISIRHRNVMSHFGIGRQMGKVHIFIEFIHGESLNSILKRFGPLSDEKSSNYTRQIVQGLHYLHTNDIAHRNVRAAKVMVTTKDVVKLISSESLKESLMYTADPNTHEFGQEYFMAPWNIWDTKADIWSLGCTVHEMATTKPPWTDLNVESYDLHMMIADLNRPLPPLSKSVSAEVTDFILRCLVRDPEKRPGADELLQDAFLREKSKPITDERALQSQYQLPHIQAQYQLNQGYPNLPSYQPPFIQPMPLVNQPPLGLSQYMNQLQPLPPQSQPYQSFQTYPIAQQAAQPQLPPQSATLPLPIPPELAYGEQNRGVESLNISPCGAVTQQDSSPSITDRPTLPLFQRFPTQS